MQGCRRIFVLGDTINGMDPSRCIAILEQTRNIVCIKGNAEYYVLTPDLDTFPLKDEDFYPNLLLLIRWWHQHMTQADFETTRSWPDFLHLDGWYMVHDLPLDRVRVNQIDLGRIDEKYREILFHGVGFPENIPADELHQISGFMDEKCISSLFVGHTHEPYIKHVDGKAICNLGSVGFTLDGDPRPSWVLCEQDDNQQKFSIRRVAYDIDQAIYRLMEVGFMDFAGQRQRNAYIKMLQTGVHWQVHI